MDDTHEKLEIFANWMIALAAMPTIERDGLRYVSIEDLPMPAREDLGKWIMGEGRKFMTSLNGTGFIKGHVRLELWQAWCGSLIGNTTPDSIEMA